MSSKKREALAEMVEYAQSAACHCQDAHIDHYLSQIIAWGKKALNEPIRNCDVGTAEEQVQRHDKYCDSHFLECGLTCTSDCIKCFATWSQMPYKKGEEK